MIPLTLALSLQGRGEGWERVKCQYYFEIGVSWVFLSNTLREVGFSMFKESATLSSRRLLRYARNDKSSNKAFFLSLRGSCLWAMTKQSDSEVFILRAMPEGSQWDSLLLSDFILSEILRSLCSFRMTEGEGFKMTLRVGLPRPPGLQWQCKSI